MLGIVLVWKNILSETHFVGNIFVDTYIINRNIFCKMNRIDTTSMGKEYLYVYYKKVVGN